MELLSKNEIKKRKSDERLLEIKEGATLAKTVDTLREKRALEEKKLAEFKESTMKEVQAQIDALISERDVIATDIVTKRDERERLMRPLTKELHDIEIRKSDLVAEEERLIVFRNELKQRDDDLIQKEIMLQEEIKNANNKKREYEFYTQQLQKQIEDTKSTFKQAEALKLQIEGEFEITKKGLEVMAFDITKRERELDIRVKQYLKDRGEMRNREVLINDKYKTFERASKLKETPKKTVKKTSSKK